MKKIAVFDYSCGKVFGIDLPKKCLEMEDVEEILFSNNYYGFKESQIYWMTVENFNIGILD